MTDRAPTPDVIEQRSWSARSRGPAIAVAALGLYVLMIDAAVETWRAVSPVRNWVAVPIALYVAYTIWLLRQGTAHRPPARASMWLSLFLLLGLLAVTSTMPGGMTDGMRVAGHPTAVVLTIANILVIVLALASFALGRQLPVVIRALGAAGAIYGLAALGIGAAKGEGYVQLLQGRSFYQPLPYWLQGAFIGALVVVPLAFAVEVMVALAVLRVRGRLHRLVAFALGAIMAYYAFSAGPS